MKRDVLVDVQVVCNPPSIVGRYARTPELRVKEIEAWCRDFEKFVHDHRSQEQVRLTVRAMYEARCSDCGRVWETDEEGRPQCCAAAETEWEKSK